MRDRLGRWLRIHRDEMALFAWTALLFFFIRLSNILLNNFAETAFLKRYGVEHLPAITALNSVVTFVLMGMITPAIARVRGGRLLARTLVVGGLTVGVVRVLMPLEIRLLYPLLYVMKTQYEVLPALLFWDMANDLFSTRQSKRIFPLVTAGGMLGGILGSFGTPLLARMLTGDNLLLAYPVFAFAGAAVVWGLGLRFPLGEPVGAPPAPPGAPRPSRISVVREVRKVWPLLQSSTLAKILLLLTLIPNLVVPILNYQFSFAVNEAFPTEASLLGFYGYFRGVQNVIALVLSFMAGRIYGRFGLPVALMFHPVNYVFTFLAFLLRFDIFSAVYAGISVGVIRRTLNAPASTALYGLLLPHQRAVLRPFLKGTVVRAAILLGSGFVYLSKDAFHPRYLSLLGLVLVAGWIATTVVLKRRYAAILLDLIRQELPSFHALDQQEVRDLIRGVDVVPVLREGFRRARGSQAVWYARILRSLGASGLDELILAKLPSEDDDTRIALLDLFRGEAGPEALDVLMEIADPDKPLLVLAVARAVKRLTARLPLADREEAFERTPMPEAKACLLGSLYLSRPAAYARVVDGWLTSPNLAERRAGVIAVGETGRTVWVPRLEEMLGTETDPALLTLILETLAKLNHPRFNELAAPFLTHPDENVRLAALGGLVIEDDHVARQVIRRMADASDRVREAAIGKLEATDYRIGPLLVEALATHSRRIRDGLFRVASSLDVSEVDMFRFFRAQLGHAYRCLATAEALGSLPESEEKRLLVRHLEERACTHVRNVLQALEGWDRTGSLAVVVRGILTGSARARTDSIEALESLIPRRLARILVPLLEEGPAGERDQIARREFRIREAREGPDAVLDRLLLGEDRVAALLALYLVERLGRVGAHREAIGRLAREAPEPVRSEAGRLV